MAPLGSRLATYSNHQRLARFARRHGAHMSNAQTEEQALSGVLTYWLTVISGRFFLYFIQTYEVL